TFKLIFTGNNKTTTVTADMVILALPFAVLRDLDYSKAGFDTLKDRAIQQLGRGRNGKLQLQFATRTWNTQGATGSSYSDRGCQVTWESTRGQAGATGILNNYTGANQTLAKLTKVAFATASNQQVVQDANVFLQQVAPIFPG